MVNKLRKSNASTVFKTILPTGAHDFKIMNYDDESIMHINQESIVQKFSREDNSPLNVFIKNIRISTGNGKLVFLDNDDKEVLTSFKEKIIIYAETNNNELFEISNPCFRRLLMFYPDLLVTEDGMMLFSMGQMMAVTYDCKNILIVRPQQVREKMTAFVSIMERPLGNPILTASIEGKGHQYYEIIPEYEEIGAPFLNDLRFEET